MEAFNTTLIASIGAFLVGAASAATGLAFNTKVADSYSAFKSCRERISRVDFPSARPLARVDRTDRTYGDPDTPAGYSPLGIANINGRRIAVYVFRNGSKVGDVAGRGEGSADIFDRAGRLIRRFTFRENLNSPPQITEYVSCPLTERNCRRTPFADSLKCTNVDSIRARCRSYPTPLRLNLWRTGSPQIVTSA
jgi:hypothetical protein